MTLLTEDQIAEIVARDRDNRKDWFIANSDDVPALLSDRDELMKRLETLEYTIEVLQSIAAEKCKPSFDEQLPKLSRSQLISIVDTDTRIAREALAKTGDIQTK